ncbi:MAG: NADH-quinone oxidoreductase subunit H, partial [Anaerolineales bacterium]
MTFLEDPVLWIAEWLRGLLLGWGASDLLTEVVLKFIGAFVVATVIMLVFVLLTWVERKGAARFQDRIGPNRVCPYGLIQPIADALKMITKEDTRPTGADAVGYVLAPIVAVSSASRSPTTTSSRSPLSRMRWSSSRRTSPVSSRQP